MRVKTHCRLYDTRDAYGFIGRSTTHEIIYIIYDYYYEDAVVGCALRTSFATLLGGRLTPLDAFSCPTGQRALLHVAYTAVMLYFYLYKVYLYIYVCMCVCSRV